MKFVYITLAFVVVFVGGFYALHKYTEPPACTDEKVTKHLNSIILNHLRTKAVQFILIHDKDIHPDDAKTATYNSLSSSPNPKQTEIAKEAEEMFNKDTVTISNIRENPSDEAIAFKALRKGCMCKARLSAPKYDIDVDFTFFAQETDQGLYVEAQGLQW